MPAKDVKRVGKQYDFLSKNASAFHFMYKTVMRRSQMSFYGSRCGTTVSFPGETKRGRSANYIHNIKQHVSYCILRADTQQQQQGVDSLFYGKKKN